MSSAGFGVQRASAHTCGGGWSTGPAELCFFPAACAPERESPSRDLSARRTLQNEKSRGEAAQPRESIKHLPVGLVRRVHTDPPRYRLVSLQLTLFFAIDE